MPTPPKTVYVLGQENKSHRTKAELASRKAYEDSLLSGTQMREWSSVKKNERAHREYLRLQKLLKNIQKNDAFYQNIINRYCLLKAECEEFEEKRERFYKSIDQMEEAVPAHERDTEYFRTIGRMMAQTIACDKQVQAKRKMMLEIERECLMTIAAALRSIPKKPVEEGEEDPMEAFLRKRQA